MLYLLGEWKLGHRPGRKEETRARKAVLREISNFFAVATRSSERTEYKFQLDQLVELFASVSMRWFFTRIIFDSFRMVRIKHVKFTCMYSHSSRSYEIIIVARCIKSVDALYFKGMAMRLFGSIVVRLRLVFVVRFSEQNRIALRLFQFSKRRLIMCGKSFQSNIPKVILEWSNAARVRVSAVGRYNYIRA